MYLLFHRLYQDYQVKLNRTVFMCWLMLLNVLNVNKILMKNVTMAISCTALIWYLIEMVASYPGSILICNCLKNHEIQFHSFRYRKFNSKDESMINTSDVPEAKIFNTGSFY